MSSDDDLKALGQRSRARDEQKAAWEADEKNAPELLAPMTDAERAKIMAAVRPGAKAGGSRRAAWGWVGGLAVAAVALIAIQLRPPDGTDALPSYGLEVRSQGYRATRSATTAASLEYVRGMAFEVLLRPARAVEGAVDAAAFRVEGARAERLEWRPDRSEGGAFRFSGEVGAQVDLPMGRSRLAFVIGAREAVQAWQPGAEGVQVLEQTIEVIEDEP